MARPVIDGHAECAAQRALYASTPRDSIQPIRAGFIRGIELCAALKPDEPGLADRLERLATHVEGIRGQIIRARAAGMRRGGGE